MSQEYERCEQGRHERDRTEDGKPEAVKQPSAHQRRHGIHAHGNRIEQRYPARRGQRSLLKMVGNQRRLLLDSRGVDVPMAYNPTFVMLSSLKPLFLYSLKKEWCFSDRAGA